MNPFGQPATPAGGASPTFAAPTSGGNPFAAATEVGLQTDLLPPGVIAKVEVVDYRIVERSAQSNMGNCIYVDVRVLEISDAPGNVRVGTTFAHRISGFDNPTSSKRAFQDLNSLHVAMFTAEGVHGEAQGVPWGQLPHLIVACKNGQKPEGAPLLQPIGKVFWIKTWEVVGKVSGKAKTCGQYAYAG